jgi:HSP20 family protein
MPIIRWSPFDPFQEMEKFFEGFPSGKSGLSNWRSLGLAPAVDVYEDDKSVIVEAPLPGLDSQDVNVSVENDILTLEGKEQKKKEVDEKNYYMKEVRFGAFHRVVALPTAVDGDKAEATYEKGVLRVVIPKKTEPQRKKQIKVVDKSK